MQKFKGAVSFKQLEGFTNSNCWRQFNKEMDMVNSDVEFINFASILNSDLIDEPFTINSNPIKLKGVQGIFRFPHKVEGILPKFMTKAFQIHFFPPKSTRGKKAHANFCFISRGSTSEPRSIKELTELNFIGATALLPSLKARVSEPQDM